MKILILFVLLTTLVDFSSNAQSISNGIVNKRCKCEATSLDSILAKYKLIVRKSTNDYKIDDRHVDTVVKSVNFLNSDFKTTVFSQVCKFRSVDFRVNGGAHLGIFDMGFQSNDLSRCLKAVKATNRQNFETKVLTRFKIIERQNELIIIYTETPYDEITQEFFNQVN